MIKLNYKVNKEVILIILVLMKLKRKLKRKNYDNEVWFYEVKIYDSLIIYVFFYIIIKMSLSVDNEYEYILNKI